MTIKFMYNGIKINGQLYKGHWSRSGYITDHKANTVCFKTVTFYSGGYGRLPRDCGLQAENDTDIMTDYIDNDRVRFTPAHTLYSEAVTAYKAQEIKSAKRTIARCKKRAANGTANKHDKQYFTEAQERLLKLLEG